MNIDKSLIKHWAMLFESGEARMNGEVSQDEHSSMVAERNWKDYANSKFSQCSIEDLISDFDARRRINIKLNEIICKRPSGILYDGIENINGKPPFKAELVIIPESRRTIDNCVAKIFINDLSETWLSTSGSDTLADNLEHKVPDAIRDYVKNEFDCDIPSIRVDFGDIDLGKQTIYIFIDES